MKEDIKKELEEPVKYNYEIIGVEEEESGQLAFIVEKTEA